MYEADGFTELLDDGDARVWVRNTAPPWFRCLMEEVSAELKQGNWRLSEESVTESEDGIPFCPPRDGGNFPPAGNACQTFFKQIKGD
jgi:hypothetical protein